MRNWGSEPSCDIRCRPHDSASWRPRLHLCVRAVREYDRRTAIASAAFCKQHKQLPRHSAECGPTTGRGIRLYEPATPEEPSIPPTLHVPTAAGRPNLILSDPHPRACRQSRKLWTQQCRANLERTGASLHREQFPLCMHLLLAVLRYTRPFNAPTHRNAPWGTCPLKHGQMEPGSVWPHHPLGDFVSEQACSSAPHSPYGHAVTTH
jgi:hypothetical protein